MTGLSGEVLELTVGEAPAPRLDKALAAVVPEGVTLSRSRIAKLIEAGAVSDGAGKVVAALKHRAAPGELYRLTIPVAVDYEAAEPEDIPLDIAFEDAHLLVVNKPAGMVVHPAPGSETGTLVNALLHYVAGGLTDVGGKARPGIVHRIDKYTSGLLVVAKTDAAHQGLAAQFAKHTIERRYLALVHGVPSIADPRLAGLSGVAFETGGVLRIATNLARHKTDRKRMAVTAHEGRHAITRAVVAEQYGGSEKPFASLIECRLETGRTHQIRVHLSHIGHGLIGDQTYGARRKLPLNRFSDDDQAILIGFQRQALHAAALGFVHPVTDKELSFTAEMPDDMKILRKTLKNPL